MSEEKPSRVVFHTREQPEAKKPELSPEVIEELQNVEKLLRAHFIIVDWQGVRILFAAAAALYVEGEMLWLRLVGASRRSLGSDFEVTLGKKYSYLFLLHLC